MIIIFISVFLIISCIIAAKRSADMQSREVLKLKENFVRDIETFPSYLPGKDLIADFYPLKSELANYPQVEISAGSAAIKKWQSRNIEIEVTAKAGAILKVRQFYFPYWQAYMGDRKVSLSRDDQYGIIKIAIDKDVSNEIIGLKLETLPAEKLGIWLSSIGFILLIFIVICDARKKAL